MSDTYLVILPLMRNAILKCVREDRSCVLYWQTEQEAIDFVQKWNLPGTILVIEWSRFVEACKRQNLEPWEGILEGNQFFEFTPEYKDEDTEYYRKFLEENFKTTDQTRPDVVKPTVERVTAPVEEPQKSLVAVVAVILVVWTTFCLAIYGVGSVFKQ